MSGDERFEEVKDFPHSAQVRYFKRNKAEFLSEPNEDEFMKYLEEQRGWGSKVKEFFQTLDEDATREVNERRND